MKRSELPDEVFGIPQERKYPMPDKKHTESAIKLFNHVEPKYEEQLAKAIIKNMKKYDIDPSMIGDKNRLKKYIKSTNESVIADTIDTIIFDIGDVLVACTSFDKAMKERNIPEQYIPILKEAWLSTEDEYIDLEEHILRAQDKLESAYVCRFMSDVAQASIETIIPFDFTNRMLCKLKERYKLYYLSNWGRGSFEELKKTWRFDFLKHFDGGVVSYETKTYKPDPAIYRILLDKYNIDPHTAIFFDDKKENVQVAKDLGMSAVVYNRTIGDTLLLTGEVTVTESSISEYGTTNGTVVGAGNVDSVYIVNYMQNNVLSGKPESKFGICKTGMKDLHIKGGKYDKIHYVSDLEEFTSQAKDIKMYRYKKKCNNFYDTIEDAVTDDDFYKGITGRTIPEKELIAFDKDFELEECFLDSLSSIRECVEAGFDNYRDDLHVIPILTEQCRGRVYNYYRDINGVFIMNELTHVRSKSYDNIDDIPESTTRIVKQGYIY